MLHLQTVSHMSTETAMNALRYRHILRYVAQTPLAIEPRRGLDVLDVLRFKAGGGQLSEDEIREYCGVSEKKAATERVRTRNGAIAVLRLRGIISHHIEQVREISGPGGTSVEGFRGRFREALASDDVGSILIDVDSPGGAVDGVEELATEIRESRGTKPIVAIANTLAASAAYWIASQADEFSVTPSGQVGSIGVFAAHENVSERLKEEGVEVTLIHAGKYKVEGNPFEPLSEEALGFFQSKVNETFEKFIDAVALGRGSAAAVVKSDFGEGRLIDSAKAVQAGMVDRVETFDQAVSRLRSNQSPASRRAQIEMRRQALAFQ